MPMGYEFGFRRKLDVVKTRPGDWEEKQFDLSDFIAEANRMKASMPSLNTEAAQHRIAPANRSEEHTSELQSLMRISYAVFCLKKKKKKIDQTNTYNNNRNKT